MQPAVIGRHHLGSQAFTLQLLFNRDRKWTVPEPFKARPQHLCSQPNQQNITIPKVVFIVVVVILIRHIPPPGDASQPIKQCGLVMHALIDGTKVFHQVTQSLQHARTHRVLRVVYTDMNICVGSKRKQCVMFRIDHQVVDNDPHPYTPVCSTQQGLTCQCANVIRAPDKILNINCAGGVVSEPGTGQQ